MIDYKYKNGLSMNYHLKLCLQSPHCAPFPEEGGLPVLRERLHCLHKGVPQLLHGNEPDEAQPEENLHIFYC